MCNPLWALAAVGGVGALTSSAASGSQAAAQKSALETQSKVAENNAAIAKIQADDALAAGRTAEATSRMQTAGLKGTQRASLAANGVSLGEGSALDLLTTTDYMGELDALTIRDNAAKQAWGYTIQADNYGTDAALLGRSAKSVDPSQAAGTSLLTGATQVAGSWYSGSRLGGGGSGSSVGNVVRGVAMPAWPTA